MTEIITWNIQCGRGVDGRVDLARIVDTIKGMADADIICLQEVARFDPELDDGKGADQVAVLAALLPDHEAVFGPALDRRNAGSRHRRQFGNLILSKLPVLQIFNHMLPQPAPSVPGKHMPRQALEVVVDMDGGPLRLTTTHLEYHSAEQRRAQVGRLREMQGEALDNIDYHLVAPACGPYAAVARPARSIICGDFNSNPDDAVYQAITAPFGENGRRYLDAWRVVHGWAAPHAPTCGIYDRLQWSEGSHCRDFFFLFADVADMAQGIKVQEGTDASDHQPILLTLNA